MQDAIQRAIELRRESQHTEALAILLDLYDKHPDDPRVNYELACTYDTQGVEDEAIGFYEHAIQCGLDGDELRGAMLGLGSSYRCVERYGDSARILHDLRSALERRELFLQFQPKIDARSLQEGLEHRGEALAQHLAVSLDGEHHHVHLVPARARDIRQQRAQQQKHEGAHAVFRPPGDGGSG